MTNIKYRIDHQIADKCPWKTAAMPTTRLLDATIGVMTKRRYLIGRNYDTHLSVDCSRSDRSFRDGPDAGLQWVGINDDVLGVCFQSFLEQPRKRRGQRLRIITDTGHTFTPHCFAQAEDAGHRLVDIIYAVALKATCPSKTDHVFWIFFGNSK